jgi:hypothetical protein
MPVSFPFHVQHADHADGIGRSKRMLAPGSFARYRRRTPSSPRSAAGYDVDAIPIKGSSFEEWLTRTISQLAWRRGFVRSRFESGLSGSRGAASQLSCSSRLTGVLSRVRLHPPRVEHRYQTARTGRQPAPAVWTPPTGRARRSGPAKSLTGAPPPIVVDRGVPLPRRHPDHSQNYRTRRARPQVGGRIARFARRSRSGSSLIIVSSNGTDLTRGFNG